MASTATRDNPRTAAVWDALDPLVTGEPLDVVDIGGGTGGSAVRLAGLGHRVRVVDPSPDALAALDRRAREAGVAVHGQQGDVSDLVDLVGPDGADLVLCHGVLEVLPGPDDASRGLDAVRAVLRAGGHLSLLLAQRHAAVVARAMAGHFADARRLLDDPGAGAGTRTGRRWTHAEALDLVAAAGLDVEEVRAVRAFTDLVPGSLLDQESGAAASLVELERAVALRPEYVPLAAQLHLLCRSA
ncbi:MAG: SAM-dependent methyltransferase [Nocardioides sp.]|nr:SAM-dependent methyltransferase [Nocardioides sp.]